jgi:hypothetical protein
LVLALGVAPIARAMAGAPCDGRDATKSSIGIKRTCGFG